MINSPKEMIHNILHKLQNIKKADSGSAFIGLDGYVDRIIKPVKKQVRNQPLFYETITDFALDCKDAAGVSRQFELCTQEVKLGGNAPIFSLALSTLGCEVTCMGNFGDDALHPVFESLHSSSKLISLGDPAETIALEFKDGKLILSELSSLDMLDWNKVSKTCESADMCNNILDSTLFALVGWSNLKKATEIWEGLLREFVSKAGVKNRIFFFDLADPSKKSDEDVVHILQVIAAFKPFGKVYLGLNENETRKLHCIITGTSSNSGMDLTTVCGELFKKIDIDTLLTHPVDKSIITSVDGITLVQGKIVEHPRISTGGGDNLNSGFCFGLMNGFSPEESAILGMANSGAYVLNGYSPNMEELKHYLSEWAKSSA